MRLRLWAVAAAVAMLSTLAVVPAQAAARRMTVAVTGVTVTPADLNQVRVTWQGGAQTTRYALSAGSDSMTNQNHFGTGWIRASDPRIRARSILLTVPARLVGVLGGGSGDYVFVKVVQTNSTGTPPICRLWTPATYCRASPSGSAALAGTLQPTASTSPLSIASWNVQSVTATQNEPGLHWSDRQPKVVRTIEAAAPDVIGTQESTTARIDTACLNPQGIATPQPCTEQYMALGAALAPDYATAGGDAWQWVYRQTARHAKDHGYEAYVDSAIYYRPTVLRLVSHGFVSPYDSLHVAAMKSVDEAGIWAVFDDLASGRRFLMVSMHLPVGDQNRQLRRTETTALAAWLTAKSTAEGGIPVVVTADLNSWTSTDPLPAVAPLRSAGFVDAASTPNRAGARWSSTNESNSVVENAGYPTTAVQHPYPTNRIDYVLVAVPGSPAGTSWSTSYENVVHLDPAGTGFDPDFQGSDHDMQLATVRLPD